MDETGSSTRPEKKMNDNNTGRRPKHCRSLGKLATTILGAGGPTTIVSARRPICARRISLYVPLTVALDDVDPAPRALADFLVAAKGFVLIAGHRRVPADYAASAGTRFDKFPIHADE